MIKVIALIFATSVLQSQSLANEINSLAIEKSELKNSTSECVKKSEGIFCINGVISFETVQEMRSIKKLSRVIVNSEGGDADSAMTIGRRIFNDGATVEVKSKCISACANYIVPAAGYLEVNENSFIVIHGAVSRGVVEYNSLIQKKTRDKLSILSTSPEFSKVRKGILKRENEYFDYILRDDSFVTRYREQVRNVLILKKVRCEYYDEFFLILDQAYFLEFGVKVKRWPNQSGRQLFDSARFVFPRANIIYGIDSKFIRLLNPIGRDCISLDNGRSEDKNDGATYNEQEVF